MKAVFEETCFYNVISSTIHDWCIHSEPEIFSSQPVVSYCLLICSCLSVWPHKIRAWIELHLLVSSNQTEAWTITHANSIYGFSLPHIISEQKNNNIISLLEKRKISATKEIWRFGQQCYILMWTLSSVVDTVHHKRAQCGKKQAKISPHTVPLLLRRPRWLAICHCVYTHQPGNCNLRYISYRRRQLWALTLWISLTWILSFRDRPGEISSLSAIKAQRPLFQIFSPVCGILWKDLLNLYL